VSVAPEFKVLLLPAPVFYRAQYLLWAMHNPAWQKIN
jgi:hypothetical protein